MDLLNLIPDLIQSVDGLQRLELLVLLVLVLFLLHEFLQLPLGDNPGLMARSSAPGVVSVPVTGRPGVPAAAGVAAAAAAAALDDDASLLLLLQSH